MFGRGVGRVDSAKMSSGVARRVAAIGVIGLTVAATLPRTGVLPLSCASATRGTRGGISRRTSASNSGRSATGPNPCGNSLGFSAGVLSKTVSLLSTLVPCRAKNPRASEAVNTSRPCSCKRTKLPRQLFDVGAKLSPVMATSRPQFEDARGSREYARMSPRRAAPRSAAMRKRADSSARRSARDRRRGDHAAARHRSG